jgi:hypothetical protein
MKYIIQKQRPDWLTGISEFEYHVQTERDALNALFQETHRVLCDKPGTTAKISDFLLGEHGERSYTVGIYDGESTVCWITANTVFWDS